MKQNALAQQHGCPEIFNSDQGAQFARQEFISILLENETRTSTDGRGRVYNNIFAERLWRTVNYEEVYLREYRTVPESRFRLNAYGYFHNTKRLHESFNYREHPVKDIMTKNQ